jgi:hypothetical protein
MLIGEPAEQCPWQWEEVLRILEGGGMAVSEVRHCPFCGRFFRSRDGKPTTWHNRHRGRFGTMTCYRAWRMDQEMAADAIMRRS